MKDDKADQFTYRIKCDKGDQFTYHMKDDKADQPAAPPRCKLPVAHGGTLFKEPVYCLLRIPLTFLQQPQALYFRCMRSLPHLRNQLIEPRLCGSG